MLSDKNLIKLSLISFLVLFILVYYVESKNEIEIVSISSLKISDVEKRVAVKGFVIKQTLIKDNLFFTIKDESEEMIAAAFGIEKEINKTKEYVFEGKIVIYNNELELIVERIY